MQAKAGEPTGMILGTLGIAMPEGAGITAQRLYFRKIGTTAYGSLSFGKSDHEHVIKDIQEKQFSGNLYYIELPAGDYEFFQHWFHLLTYYGVGPMVSSTYMSKREFSVPFRVEAGKTNYLGEFSAYLNTQDGIQKGIVKIANGGYLVVSDKIDRDSAAYANIPGAINGRTLVNATLDPSGNEAPIKKFCNGCSVSK